MSMPGWSKKGLGLRIGSGSSSNSSLSGLGIAGAATGSPGSDKDDGSVKGSESGLEAGVVKIGQTTLHNPGGQSSWIGL